MRGLPGSCYPNRSGSLALHDDHVAPIGVMLAGFKAQTGIEALKALGVGEGRHSPLLVRDKQERDLLEQLGRRCQIPQDAERERIPTLHVDSA